MTQDATPNLGITSEANRDPGPVPTPEPFSLTANPFGLSFRERVFIGCLPLTTPPFNVTEAYGRAGFKGGQRGRHNAARLFAKPRIQAAIEATYGPRLQQLTMSGEEALERLTVFARGVDIRKVFSNHPMIAGLSDEIAACVKGVRLTKHGPVPEFYDAMRAAEVLAKAGGKLKDAVVLERSLEDIVAEANQQQSGAAAPHTCGAPDAPGETR